METDATPPLPRRRFSRLAVRVSTAAGRPLTFAVSVFLILTWAATGPFFHFSATWQLVVNTLTTIVTFLMVFLIQNTQNRDTAAIHIKLDELIRVTRDARNGMMQLGEMEDEDLQRLRNEMEGGEQPASAEERPPRQGRRRRNGRRRPGRRKPTRS